MQVAIKPFLLACECKSPKLVGLALISMHKLVTTNALPAEEAMEMLKAMEQVRSSAESRVMQRGMARTGRALLPHMQGLIIPTMCRSKRCGKRSYS